MNTTDNALRQPFSLKPNFLKIVLDILRIAWYNKYS